LHDYAALRAINNIDIVAPADNFETQAAITAALAHPRPLYIRFGKKPMPHLHAADTKFEIGKAITLSTGSDVTFIATGETVAPAVMAAQLLAEEGIACRVISMHTIKPLDEEALLAAARDTKAMLTVEEHSIFGGLGSACAEVLLQKGVCVPFKIVGIPDEDTVTGSQSDIFKHYGISPEGLAGSAKGLLRAKVK
jgi:transketolase